MTFQLILAEEILLLALRDEDGKLEASWIGQTLAGAVLAELALDGHININAHDDQLVSIAKGRPHNPLLRDALDRISGAKKPAGLKIWITDLATHLDLMNRTAEQLVEKGVLKLEKQKILFFFTSKRYPEVDPRPEAAIHARLKSAIEYASQPLDDRTRLLIALARSSLLITANLGKEYVNQHKDRIDAILAEDLSGQATLKAISDAQNALLMATTMTSINTAVLLN